MEDFLKESKPKRSKIPKIILAVIIGLMLTSIIAIVCVYAYNEEFRLWVDNDVLPKKVMQGETVSLEIKGENEQIFAVDKYIVKLQEKTVKFYNTLGTEISSFSVEINKAIVDITGKYMCIAEENGRNAYIIADKEIIWKAETEGNILQVEINENGYVGIVTSDVSYKNIVTVYDQFGKQLLKTYLATTKICDISISNNNHYLAIAEVETSGILIQSTIKVISIEKAQKDPENSIEYTYNAEINKLIFNIQYQNKDRLVCMYNDTIDIIEERQSTTILKLDKKNITFCSIGLNDNLVYIEENVVGKRDYSSVVHVLNIINKKDKTYPVEKATKNIYAFENVIGINFGTELHLINRNGWLIKKYIAEQGINNIVMSNKIVGIIYRDKIEIVDI